MLRKVSMVSGIVRPYTALSPYLRPGIQTLRSTSSKTADPETTTAERVASTEEQFQASAEEISEKKKKKKTQAELDEELRQKLEGISGDGGAAGLELEDGQPVSMKRSVKNNMFRYI